VAGDSNILRRRGEIELKMRRKRTAASDKGMGGSSGQKKGTTTDGAIGRLEQTYCTYIDDRAVQKHASEERSGSSRGIYVVHYGKRKVQWLTEKGRKAERTASETPLSSCHAKKDKKPPFRWGQKGGKKETSSTEERRDHSGEGGIRCSFVASPLPAKPLL